MSARVTPVQRRSMARPDAQQGRRIVVMHRVPPSRPDASPAGARCADMRDRGVVPFGDGCLDIGQRRLVDRLGRDLLLRNKAFELLCALHDGPGQVVARGELLDLVWSGIHVTDDNVTQCVAEISRQRRYISGTAVRTVSRHGYALDLAAPAPRLPVLAVSQLRALGHGAADT